MNLGFGGLGSSKHYPAKYNGIISCQIRGFSTHSLL